MIYRALYKTLHLIYTLYELFTDIYRVLVGKCNQVRNVQINKVPTHLTVLLGQEEPSVPDLTNLVLWCLAARITFISFYDHKGVLKKVEDKLYDAIVAQKRLDDHVIWHHDPNEAPRNGFTGRKIHVKVLSNAEAKPGIVALTKQLPDSHSITLNTIDVGLKRLYEFPDPDLGLCCGKTFSLYSYPPWQIQVTEFFQIISHHNISFNTFIDVLNRFSKCEQRFGK